MRSKIARMRPLRFKFALGAVFLLGGCGDSDLVSCSPPTADDTFAEQAVTHGYASNEAQATFNVYVDGSGSMVGYVDDRGSAYAEVVASFPQITDLLHRDADYYIFGRTIEQLSDSDYNGVSAPDFYRRDWFNDFSQINDVFEQALKLNGNALTVVVTDLFLSGEDVAPGSSRALRQSLGRFLNRGKSIAFLGVDSRFNGTIYDLPGSVNQVSHRGENTRRPFFVILIGNENEITTFYHTLNKDVLRYFDGVAHHFTMFSKDLLMPVDLRNSSNEIDGIEINGSAARPARILKQSDIPQVLLRRGQDTLTIPVELPKEKVPPRPSADLGNIQISSERLYIYRPGSTDCDNTRDWRKIKLSKRISEWHADPWSNIQIFEAKNLSRQLNQGGIFFLEVDLISTVPARDGESLDWLHSWSFLPNDIDQLLEDKPEFFPALNLSRLADIMLNEVVDAYEPEPVARVRVVFRIE